MLCTRVYLYYMYLVGFLVPCMYKYTYCIPKICNCFLSFTSTCSCTMYGQLSTVFEMHVQVHVSYVVAEFWDFDCRPLITPVNRWHPNSVTNSNNNRNNGRSISETEYFETSTSYTTAAAFQANADVEPLVTERSRSNSAPKPSSGNIINVEYTTVGVVIFFIAFCVLILPLVYERHKKHREVQLAAKKLAEA